MKKVLILSYHSLPFDVIASYRTNAYLMHFKKFNIEPTVFTHFMGMEAQKEVVIQQSKFGKIHRIPLKRNRIVKTISFFESIPFLNKISILYRWLNGLLDPRIEDFSSYYSMRHYCFNRASIRSYDLIISIFSPHHHLRLAYEINREYGIPYVVDFRDLWSNRVSIRDYQPNNVERIQDFFVRRYWKKWLSNARFFTITSEPWRKTINEFTNTKGYVITNGFDIESFDTLNRSTSSEDFVITYAGSLYEHQRIDLFLSGCKSFINNAKPRNFKVRFIGSNRGGAVRGSKVGFMFDPQKTIFSYLDKRYVEILDRLPKDETIAKLRSSQLLLFLSHSNVSGWHSGKIFDYLAAQRTILMVPDDGDVVTNLIKQTNSGVIKNTPKEVEDFLQSIYEDWTKKGEVSYAGLRSEIYKYSREEQVRKMSTLLKN